MDLVISTREIYFLCWKQFSHTLCIVTGVENLDSGVGLYACDPEAYSTFRELFDGVIRDYHKVPAGTAIAVS